LVTVVGVKAVVATTKLGSVTVNVLQTGSAAVPAELIEEYVVTLPFASVVEVITPPLQSHAILEDAVPIVTAVGSWPLQSPKV
jgi:hypothetical protein